MAASLARLVLGDGRLVPSVATEGSGVAAAVRHGGARGVHELQAHLEVHLTGPGLVDATAAVLACRRLGERTDDIVAGLDQRCASPSSRARSDQLGRRLLDATRPLWSDHRVERLARRDRLPQPVALGSVAAACRLGVDDAAELSLHGATAALCSEAVRLRGLDPAEVHDATTGLRATLACLARRAARARSVDELPDAPSVVVDLPPTALVAAPVAARPEAHLRAS